MESPRVEKTEAGLAFVGVMDCQTVPALMKQMPAPKFASDQTAEPLGLQEAE